MNLTQVRAEIAAIDKEIDASRKAVRDRMARRAAEVALFLKRGELQLIRSDLERKAADAGARASRSSAKKCPACKGSGRLAA